MINTRVYWTVPGETDKAGQPTEYDTKPKTGFAGLGINAATPVSHRETLYENGDVVVERLDPASDAWQQENVLVDTARRDAYEKEQQAAAQQAAGTKAEAAGSRAEAAAGRDEAHRAAQTDIQKQRLEIEKQQLAGQQASAARQEKRELTMAEYQQQHLAFEREVAEGRMTAEQAQRAEERWYRERLLEHQAAQEQLASRREDRSAAAQEAANAVAQGHLGIQARGMTLQEQQAVRQTQADERLAGQQQQNLLFNQQKAGMDFGQNRVQNALATMPYRVGPGFAQSFAQGLSTLSGGGGQVNFNPSDFQVQIPDQDRMMEEGFRRAMAIFGVSPPAVAPNAPGGPLPLPPAYPGYPSMPR
jgi:hypothetical protein